MTKKFIKLVLASVVILFFTSTTTIAEESSKGKTVKQAREIVQMLDDLYKTFIVLITAEYVNDPSVLPAATLSKRVFEAMSKKGWHKARLLDATGTPFNPDNNPKDKFERDAIKAIISGRTYFERVEKIEGKDYLRAATAVPVVIKGCTICHPDKKVGDLLGAISYSIPLKKLDFY
ncbi:MAG: DUF3365 domain-containing protein [Candidatus Scalinduaceae bacterium]